MALPKRTLTAVIAILMAFLLLCVAIDENQPAIFNNQPRRTEKKGDR